MENNIERLRLLNLPVFSNIDELASLMHVDPKRLSVLSKSSKRFYIKYTIPKSSGGVREIRQPSREIKAVQAWLLRNILDKLTPSEHATAFIQGKGLSQNVSPHSNNRYFVCLDIQDFYPSISFHRIKHLFKIIGYFSYAPSILADLCICDIGLPQGGVTSPSISNLIASRLDRRLSGYTSRRNITYTRYADDMTFSSNNRAALNKSINTIKKIIESEQFTPHPNKFRVMGPRICCHVTGLIKNSSEPSFGIGKKKKRNMRRIIHHLVTGKSIDHKYSTGKSIDGWLSFLKSVDAASYKQMRIYWENLKNKYSFTY
jgi:retron-type reverse transcriptase